MKQVYAGAPIWVIVSLLVSVFLINGIATYLQYDIVPSITKFISIIVILTFYYTRQYRMATVFLTIFMFLFLANLFSVFDFGDLAGKLSTTFSIGGYCLLIFVLLGNLRRIKYEGLVSVYLVLILLLNTYFLYILYGVLKDNFTDNVELVLSICLGITLIGMAFFAFAVYLSKETTQSIVFLAMVFSFIFSDVLNYICNFYVYYWVFDFMCNMLNLASLCLFFVYVFNHHKVIKAGRKESQEEYILESNNDRITA